MRRAQPQTRGGAAGQRFARRARARGGAGTRAGGQNKAKVLDALKAGPMTASEIAKVTGIGTATVSTMLTKMAKTGELAKAERGYKLSQ